MKRVHVSPAIAAFTFAALLLVAAPLGATPFNQLVVVGDSLSDTGNVFALTGNTFPPSPPNFEGRFSNGPVWVEELALTLGLPAPAAYLGAATSGRTNFALGGAGTDLSGTTTGSIDMRTQVGWLATDSSITDLGDSLFVVRGGANDFLNNVLANPTTSVGNLVGIVNDLIGLGAESLLLPNLPPLDQTPEFRQTAAEGLAANFSTVFNTSYAVAVDELRADNPSVAFYYFDVYALLRQVLADPIAFGFTNTIDRAFDGSSVVSNPDDYLYWDGVHPTRAGHAQLGAFAADLFVPAPPVLLLLLPGLAFLLVRLRARHIDSELMPVTAAT